jgi:hypothetical protein
MNLDASPSIRLTTIVPASLALPSGGDLRFEPPLGMTGGLH